jgi:hypothetical protein
LSRNALRLRIRLQDGRSLSIHFPKPHLCLVTEGFTPKSLHALSIAQIRRRIATMQALGFKDGEVTHG